MIQLQGHVLQGHFQRQGQEHDKDKSTTRSDRETFSSARAHAVVSLPTGNSPILTRELLSTAVTRGKERLTVVASEAALRAAVNHPVARARGRRERLWPAAPEGDA
jgi:hypothetical protein